MSLTASMWTSVSGLLCHGEKMNVIGNNISNINTVGFKAQRMDFMDFVYQSVGTAKGQGQVGRGTSIGAIMNDFGQGAHETTTSSTDIAIQDTGFFKVKPLNNDQEYYTRAGNFYFNKDGYLVNPQGYVLQGWGIDRDLANQVSGGRTTGGVIGTGSPRDIKLDTFTCPPRHTTNMTMPLGLYPGSSATDIQFDKSTDTTDPFFALLKSWDATQSIPLGSDKYAHQFTMDVYDEGGKLHKLTVYVDRVTHQDDPDNPGTGAQPLDNTSPNMTHWEFIVTMDPDEDVREFGSEYDPTGTTPTTPNVPDKLKGLLAAGTMSFTSSGDMKDMSMYVPNDSLTLDANDVIELNTWALAPLSTNGTPMFAPNFSGTAGLQDPFKRDAGGVADGSPNPNADGLMIALNLGLTNKASAWSAAAAPTADLVINDVANIWAMGTSASQGNIHSTTNVTSYSIMSGVQHDGYTYGDFLGVSVSTDGVLSAYYTNGQTLELYQITLYDFASKQNLRREGGNLYSETLESGVANYGAAGSGVFGTTHGNSLEQSNADLSREFVNMITTQRGFQANSKTITTVDTMLETVIGMKR